MSTLKLTAQDRKRLAIHHIAVDDEPTPAQVYFKQPKRPLEPFMAGAEVTVSLDAFDQQCALTRFWQTTCDDYAKQLGAAHDEISALKAEVREYIKAQKNINRAHNSVLATIAAGGGLVLTLSCLFAYVLGGLGSFLNY